MLLATSYSPDPDDTEHIKIKFKYCPACLICHSKLSQNGFRIRKAYTLESGTLNLVKYKLPRWQCPRCHSRYHTLPYHLLYRKRYALNVYEYIYERQSTEIALELNDSMIRNMKQEAALIRSHFIQRYGIEQAEILCRNPEWLQKMVYMNQLFYLNLPTNSLEEPQFIWYHDEKA